MRFLGREASPLQRIRKRIDLMRQGRLRSYETYLPYVSGKSGLEIGGPSGAFKKGKVLPIY